MATSEPIRIAIANDYEVVVRGVHAMLAPFPDRVAVVELDVQEQVETPVDITLYDTFSETQADDRDIDDMLDNERAGTVVVYTWNMQPQLVEVALAKGCGGYLDKAMPADELLRALELIAGGDIVISPTTVEGPAQASDPGGDWPGRAEGLSAREAEVLALITQGLTNSDIATRTYLSINSVKTYIRTAYRKIGVSRRSQAVRWGLEHGMTPDRMRVHNPQPREPEERPGA
ncbi:response regulator transcription factor [Ornithinimicrobium panacihumi]|uniref:response regulator transcription factor n=1 Tax=Ornithinimicrobium panacihumi TaxID=2008449 RepID=UPI003F8AB364